MIQISDKTKCCGCRACSEICPKQCINMERDSEGFLYPVVDKEICIDCGMCEKYARKFMWKKLEQVIGIFRKYFLPMP